MPGGLSPNTAPPIKFESVAISATCSILSTTCWPPNAAGVGGLSPWQPAAYLGQRYSAQDAAIIAVLSPDLHDDLGLDRRVFAERGDPGSGAG